MIERTEKFKNPYIKIEVDKDSIEDLCVSGFINEYEYYQVNQLQYLITREGTYLTRKDELHFYLLLTQEKKWHFVYTLNNGCFRTLKKQITIDEELKL